MLMTKEQAAKVWCPMVRAVVCDDRDIIAAGAATFNRVQSASDVHLARASTCAADRCAMWRWNTPLPLASQSQGDAWTKGMVPAEQPARLGYCGLAGKP